MSTSPARMTCPPSSASRMRSRRTSARRAASPEPATVTRSRRPLKPHPQDVPIVQLPATLTLAQASKAAAALADATRQASSDGLTVDASALNEFDTSALAVLLHAHRAARSRAIPLRVTGAPPKLCQLAALYGVAGLLGLEGQKGLEGASKLRHP